MIRSIKEKKKRSEQKVKQFLQRNNLQTMPTFTRHDTVTVEPTDSATQEIQTTPTQRKHIKHLKKHALTELVKQQTKKFKKNNSRTTTHVVNLGESLSENFRIMTQFNDIIITTKLKIT